MGVSSWDFPNSQRSFSLSRLLLLPLLLPLPTILMLTTTSTPTPATTAPTMASLVAYPPLSMRPIPAPTVLHPTSPKFPTQAKSPQPLTLNRRRAPATRSKSLLLLLLLSHQAHPRPPSPSQIQLDLTTTFLLAHNTLATTLESSLTKWPPFLQPHQPLPTWSPTLTRATSAGRLELRPTLLRRLLTRLPGPRVPVWFQEVPVRLLTLRSRRPMHLVRVPSWSLLAPL